MLQPTLEHYAARFRRFRHGQRGWPLFVLSAPLLLAALAGLAGGDLALAGGAGAGFAAVLAGGLVARRGFRAEAEDRPPPPRFRAATALLTALGTGLGAWLGAGHALPVAAIFALLAAGAVRLLYGADVRPPRPAGDAAMSLAGDGAVIAAARDRLAHIERLGQAVPQPDFAAAIARIVRIGRQIVAEAEADPADLRRARRFLGIYLDGTERVAARYVETHRGLPAPVFDANFRALLFDLERAFVAQHDQLKATDRRALDIEIEVLQKRLQEEGLYQEKVSR